MNNILEIIIVLGVIILPIMLLILKIVQGIAKLNMNDYFMLATF
jgi:hypothetical protein